MTADPFDLGIDPEHSYEEESWRPSADYPEVTRHRLRRVGDRLDVLTTPPHHGGQPCTRRARILAVWRNVLRAEVRFDGTDLVTHFDLVTRRLIELPGEFRLEVPAHARPARPGALGVTPHDARSRGPTALPRAHIAVVHARGDGVGAVERAPLGTLRVGAVARRLQFHARGEEVTARVECWCATSIVPHLCVVLMRPHDHELPSSAMIQGYFNPGVAAVDAAVARLRAVLVG
ncbi:MAG: hypothetical protein IPN17_29135 [Deltaproteobacteria bacterium]|nr:hypothetical protein [Deltaproteobacteria bacterium]